MTNNKLFAPLSSIWTLQMGNEDGYFMCLEGEDSEIYTLKHIIT